MEKIIQKLKSRPLSVTVVESFDQEYDEWIETRLQFSDGKFYAEEDTTHWELKWSPTEEELLDPEQFRTL